jgi:GAF domain-containing protein
MPPANRSDRTTDDLRVQALQFLLDLHDLNVPPDVAIGSLCALAEQFQPGATVGGSIIDSRSASSFDRAVFPSLPASLVSTLRHSPISPPYIGTCAQAVCEKRIVTCPDVATETGFDAAWRGLYLGLGIHSVQSAPVFSFDGKPLGTFVIASKQPHASFDTEMTGFGVYGMQTILLKTSDAQ